MAASQVMIDGRTLSIESLTLIRDGLATATLSNEAITRMQASRKAVEDILDSDKTVYGINTGFGAMSSVQIDSENLAKLQLNLIRSHACGVGELMSPEHVLMMPEFPTARELARITIIMRTCSGDINSPTPQA
jgi:histidine ammonia-lyase